MNRLLRKLDCLIHRSRAEAELREELAFHLEEETEAQQARGLSTQDARHAARRSLGNLSRVAEEMR